MDEKTVNLPEEGRQIEEAISLFEGILQSSPEDRIALEALSLAYEQTGNLPLARATLLRLAQVIIRKNEHASAPAVILRLKPLIENDFDALEAMQSLEALMAAQGQASDGTSPSLPAVSAPPVLRSGVALRRQVLRREMELAWNLLEAKELKEEEYAAVVEDLSRLVADERHSTISLLHTLVDRAFPGIDRVMHYLSKASQVPFLALECFEVQKVDLGGLSLEYLLRLGALPFEQMGSERIIALLNPLAEDLQREVSAHLGGKCHFYLVSAEAFDAAAKKLRPPEEVVK
jgi:tetratricopeptide (TPR) repeat protein